MNEINYFINKVVNKQNLSQVEAQRAMQIIIAGGATPMQIASYVTALSVKEVVSDEIVGSVLALWAKIKPTKSLKGPVTTFKYIPNFCTSQQSLNLECAIILLIRASDIHIIGFDEQTLLPNSTAKIFQSYGYNTNLNFTQYWEVFDKLGLAFFIDNIYQCKLAEVPLLNKELLFSSIFHLILPFLAPIAINNLIILSNDMKYNNILIEAGKKLGITSISVINVSNSNILAPDSIYINSTKNNAIRIAATDLEQSNLNNFSIKNDFPLEINDRLLYEILNGTNINTYSNIIIAYSAICLLILQKVPSFHEGVNYIQYLLKEKKALRWMRLLVRESNQFLINYN